MDLPSDADIDRACRFAAARITARLAEHGIPDEGEGIGVDPGTNGTVLLYRTRMTAKGIQTGPTYLSPTNDPDRPLDNRSLEALDLEIDRHARRRLRLRSLEAAGVVEGERPPAWSHTIHRLALGWFRIADVDPLLAVGGMDSDAYRAFSFLCDQRGLSTGTLRMEDGRMDFSSVTTSGDIQLIGHGRPALLIDREIPDTLASAMIGRLVSEVVDHPAIRRSGPVRIQDVDNRDGLLTLILPDVQDFLRRPPVGTDRRWRAIPYRPLPSDN